MSLNKIELNELLERAAENATGCKQETAEFVRILENEWITDVDALRRTDGDALDELLPLLLSRELQRLIHHDDCNTAGWQKPRGPSKSSKNMRSPTRSESSFHKNKATYNPPPPGVVRISEEEESSTASSSTGSKDDGRLFKCEMACIGPSSSKPKKLPAMSAIKYDPSKYNSKKEKDDIFKMFDLFDRWCSYSSKNDGDEPNDISSLIPDGEGVDDDELQRMSNTQPFVINSKDRPRHIIADASRKADFITNARRKYSTREALEDAILEYQTIIDEEKAELEDIIIIASKSSEDDSYQQEVDKKKQLISTAEDELRGLYPMRLILHTVGDLTEMIIMLQWHRERAMRDLNMEKAKRLQKEIDDVSLQINNEDEYLLKKKLREVKCVTCEEKFVPVSLSGVRQSLLGGCDGNAAAGSSNDDKVTSRQRRCNTCHEKFGYENGKEQSSVLRRILSVD